MDFQPQAPWGRPQLLPYNNSMMASRADQHQDPSSSSFFPVDAHWIENLEPSFRRVNPESQQEWEAHAQTLEPGKTFTNSSSSMQNQNHQGQQQYSYQEAHQTQTVFPAAVPQLLTSDLPYGLPSSSLGTQWAPSPGADSRDSSALSPTSERDYRHDMSLNSSPFGGGMPLERSLSGISELSHQSTFWTRGGGQQFQQTTASMAMINPQLEVDEVGFGGEESTFGGHEEMFMNHEPIEQESSPSQPTLAPRPPTAHFLHPHSPGPSSLHHNRHVSPAPSAYSTHSTHSTHNNNNNNNNQPNPHLTLHHHSLEIDDTDTDIDIDLPSPPLPPADDTDTDSTYTPNPRIHRTPKRRPRPCAQSAPYPPPTPGVRGGRRKPNPPSSGGGSGRSNTANPTFPCTFAWAGCTSAFGAKNEWKRHVASKHTCFFYWECRVGTCAAPAQRGTFNRKDLFAQHLRRMHAPPPSVLAKGSKAKEDWNVKLRAYLEEGKKEGRGAIRECACPVTGCGEVWKGTRAWEERMEHVARHWEGVKGGVVGWDERGGGVEEWAVREGVVRSQGGGWVVVEGGVGEVDAVGEEE
ncbi:hypothetical protein VE03_01843 [Pseudogymnoascus sp. 23342-1-I1]|nr:hypothetical protein VE03_01843 [Pseudogymnoascus sp. 23342-1-I1]